MKQRIDVDSVFDREPTAITVKSVEDYDGSDAGIAVWFRDRLVRAHARNETTEEQMGRFIGTIAAGFAVEGGLDPINRARLMQLADDYELHGETSVLARVFTGQIDLSSFVELGGEAT